VLRYWESEFSALAPAKNSSGQRIYRRRDIETVLRIKQLLYDEGFTIAGAKKKLEVELAAKSPTPQSQAAASAELLEVAPPPVDERALLTIRQVRDELRAILTLLDRNDKKP
jgi:DNA-binding transcriptional MerR regulator